MTPEEHKARHQELHRMADELYADYLRHSLKIGSHRDPDFFPVTVNRLMEWSYKQTQSPDELPDD